jgi:hypothetical protein
MSPFEFKRLLECWAGHDTLDKEDYIELADIMTYLIPIVERTGTVHRDYILQIFDEFIYQTHNKALSKSARDTLLAEELKKPVCDRPLNQKGATILTNQGFLLERAEKATAASELLAERQAAADAKAAGTAVGSHVKLFMSIVPLAFGIIVCPTVRTSQILLNTTGRIREFLFTLHSMRSSTEEELCNLRSTSTGMLKLVKLTTRLFPVTWKKNKARNSINTAVANVEVPRQALGTVDQVQYLSTIQKTSNVCSVTTFKSEHLDMHNYTTSHQCT